MRSAAEAARALGLRHGPLHAELRLNAEGAWPVDVAARSIGGLCARALRFGTGMSLEELLLRHATGAPIASLERTGAASGVMMIPIPAAGVLRSVEGLDAARAVASIEAIEMTIRPGQQVVPLPEGGEYLGFIFARADDPRHGRGRPPRGAPPPRVRDRDGRAVGGGDSRAEGAAGVAPRSHAEGVSVAPEFGDVTQNSATIGAWLGVSTVGSSGSERKRTWSLWLLRQAARTARGEAYGASTIPSRGGDRISAAAPPRHLTLAPGVSSTKSTS